MAILAKPMLRLGLICLLFVGPTWPQTGTPPTAAITAEEIIRRWADAVGGKKLRTIRNVHTRGAYDGTYGHGVDEEWDTRLGQKKQLNVVEEGERLHVFDGTHGWTRSRTGEVRPLSDREAAVQRNVALIGSMDHLTPDGNAQSHFEYQGQDASGCC